MKTETYKILTEEEKSFIKEEVLTTKEVGTILGVSRQQVFNLVRQGKLIPFKQESNVTLFFYSDIISYLLEKATSVLPDTLRQIKVSYNILTDSDVILSDSQKTVLEELDKKGYGIYISDNFYMPIPILLRESNFPIDLYDSHTDSKITISNWEELVNLSNSI